MKMQREPSKRVVKKRNKAQQEMKRQESEGSKTGACSKVLQNETVNLSAKK